MGEHKNNVTSIFKKSLPPQAVGAQFGTGITTNKALGANVILLPPDKVREVDGKREIFGRAPMRDGAGNLIMTPMGPQAEDIESWHVPPEPYKVRIVGEELTDDDFDAVFVVISVCHHAGGIVTAGGGVKQTVLPICELSRMPWKAFLAAHKGEST